MHVETVEGDAEEDVDEKAARARCETSRASVSTMDNCIAARTSIEQCITGDAPEWAIHKMNVCVPHTRKG
jgi:hypothetical protein